MKITEDTYIEAPIEDVFKMFTDLKQIEQKISGIQKIEVLEGASKMKVGTKWQETRVMFGKEASEVMSVTDIEPNKMYKTIASSHGMRYESSYYFSKNKKGTLVRMEFVGTPLTIVAKLLTPMGLLFKGATKKAFVKDMIELKAALEK